MREKFVRSIEKMAEDDTAGRSLQRDRRQQSVSKDNKSAKDAVSKDVTLHAFDVFRAVVFLRYSVRVTLVFVLILVVCQTYSILYMFPAA